MIQPQVCPGAPSRIQQITRCTDTMDKMTQSMRHFSATGEPAAGWPAKNYNLYALIGFMDWYEELHRLIWEE